MTRESNIIPYSLTDAKVVLGIRCSPRLKQELSEEATELNVSLSEMAEYILENRNEANKEADNLRRIIEDQEHKLKQLNTQLEEIEKWKSAYSALQKKLEQFNSAASILSNERLLQLFNQLKGREDIVENTEGDAFPITYNTPTDLLTAMIYSFKLKES